MMQQNIDKEERKDLKECEYPFNFLNHPFCKKKKKGKSQAGGICYLKT